MITDNSDIEFDIDAAVCDLFDCTENETRVIKSYPNIF